VIVTRVASGLGTAEVLEIDWSAKQLQKLGTRPSCPTTWRQGAEAFRRGEEVELIVSHNHDCGLVEFSESRGWLRQDGKGSKTSRLARFNGDAIRGASRPLLSPFEIALVGPPPEATLFLCCRPVLARLRDYLRGFVTGIRVVLCRLALWSRSIDRSLS
jgi:hypothetical protein